MTFRDSEGVNIGGLIQAAAEKYVEPYIEQPWADIGLLALGRAESNWRRDAARYGTWPDVSFGYGQITVALAKTWSIGDGTPASTETVRVALLDRELSIRCMADYLGWCLAEVRAEMPSLERDDLLLGAMINYNSGSPQEPGNWFWQHPQWSQNIRRYQECIKWAHGLMGL